MTLQPKINEITGIIAPKGAGKTHLSSRLFSECKCAVAFNVMCEPSYTLHATDLCAGNLEELTEMMRQNEYRIDYRPSYYDLEEGKSVEFDWTVKLCYLRKNVTLFIEEAHMFCTSHSMPQDLLLAVRMGRHRGLSITYVTQSYAAVTRPLTSNTNRFYFFGMFDPRELQAIEERTGPECAEAVSQLERLKIIQSPTTMIWPGEIIEWRDNGQWSRVQQDVEARLDNRVPTDVPMSSEVSDSD